MSRLPALVIALLTLSACNGVPPPNTATIASPAAASLPIDDSDKPPAFDRNGNANYDAQGNYIGGHGVGTTVDAPDDNPLTQPLPANVVCQTNAEGNAGVCKSQ